MVELVARTSKVLSEKFRYKHILNLRMLFAVLLGIVMLSDTQYALVVQNALSQAYLSVSVFIMMTLACIYTIEKAFKVDVARVTQAHPLLEIPLCSFLGALPGCGGAIIVITQFMYKKISFGAVLATMVATMGDAAFLLMAKQPFVWLTLALSSFLLGIVLGFMANVIHGRDYIQPNIHLQKKDSDQLMYPQILKNLWWVLILPSSVIGILMSFQIEFNYFGIDRVLGAVGAWFSLFMWSLCHKHCPPSNYKTPCVLNETVQITTPVVMAFLIYESLMFFLGIDLRLWFNHALWLMPLIGVMVGFIPGCGPQIIVTTLYLQGIIPLSAQIGNAISNEGDALLPILSKSPKFALIITLYTAIPSILIAYTFFFLGY